MSLNWPWKSHTANSCVNLLNCYHNSLCLIMFYLYLITWSTAYHAYQWRLWTVHKNCFQLEYWLYFHFCYFKQKVNLQCIGKPVYIKYEHQNKPWAYPHQDTFVLSTDDHKINRYISYLHTYFMDPFPTLK